MPKLLPFELVAAAREGFVVTIAGQDLYGDGLVIVTVHRNGTHRAETVDPYEEDLAEVIAELVDTLKADR